MLLSLKWDTSSGLKHAKGLTQCPSTKGTKELLKLNTNHYMNGKPTHYTPNLWNVPRKLLNLRPSSPPCPVTLSLRLKRPERARSKETSWYTDRLRLGRSDFEFRKRQETFSLFRNQIIPLFNGSQGTVCPRRSDLCLKVTTHLHLVPKTRIVDLYLYAPIRLHGVVLNWLCTRKMSPLDFCPMSYIWCHA
jgi:hypothetical protein